MIYMLDTNACIEHLRNPASAVGYQMALHWRDDFVVSASTEFELRYGALRSMNPARELDRVATFLQPLECVPLDRYASQLAAEVRRDLESRGAMIGSLDLLIAATAIVRGSTLITHNVDEFARV
jgi:tRNA(fMet)-specific endonuclease VapC